jgi:hypothetical protein
MNFMILQTMDQKLWVFEVFLRSLGRAGMCWSQPTRVDHMHKKRKAEGKKISTKDMQGLTRLGVDRDVITDNFG